MIKRLTYADKDFFLKILTDKDIKPFISDDKCLHFSPSDIEMVLKSDNIICLTNGLNAVGIFVPCNSVTYEVHTLIQKAGRGKEAVQSSLEGIKWMFENTNCKKIVTHVPEFNIPAFALATKIGMKKEGINRKSFLKNGCLYNQILMGLCKEEFICQQ